MVSCELPARATLCAGSTTAGRRREERRPVLLLKKQVDQERAGLVDL